MPSNNLKRDVSDAQRKIGAFIKEMDRSQLFPKSFKKTLGEALNSIVVLGNSLALHKVDRED